MTLEYCVALAVFGDVAVSLFVTSSAKHGVRDDKFMVGPAVQ